MTSPHESGGALPAEFSWDAMAARRAAVFPGHAADLVRLRALVGDDLTAGPMRILRLLTNDSLWTCEWIGRFVGIAERMQAAEGWASVQRRLLRRDRFEEALSVLEVGGRFHAAGMSVAFDVKVDVNGKTKEPDLAVDDAENGCRFHCEVSTLARSQEDRHAAEMADGLAELVMMESPPGMTMSGRLLKVVARRRAADIAQQVRAAIREASDARALRDVVIPRVVELAIAPDACAAEMATWCALRGIEPGSFSSPGPPIDEVRRIRVKAREEGKQLPPELPNVMVLYANDIFVQAALARASHETLVSALEEVVYDRPELAFLVVATEDFGAPDPEAQHVGIHHYDRRVVGGVVCQTVLLSNPYSDAQMPAGTASKVRAAFGAVR